jgi:serine-type D-Ala-D-Ala carboxypeptidase (penicillin-binding protein 5/6)
MKNGNLLFGRKENLKREIASLTKIMTFYTTITLLDRYRLSADKVVVKISQAAAQMTGTSAGLKEGEEFTVT